MEVNKRASIKSIPYDEFKDNDTLEKIAQELNEGGANVVVGSLDAFFVAYFVQLRIAKVNQTQQPR